MDGLCVERNDVDGAAERPSAPGASGSRPAVEVTRPNSWHGTSAELYERFNLSKDREIRGRGHTHPCNCQDCSLCMCRRCDGHVKGVLRARAKRGDLPIPCGDDVPAAVGPGAFVELERSDGRNADASFRFRNGRSLCYICGTAAWAFDETRRQFCMRCHSQLTGMFDGKVRPTAPKKAVGTRRDMAGGLRPTVALQPPKAPSSIASSAGDLWSDSGSSGRSGRGRRFRKRKTQNPQRQPLPEDPALVVGNGQRLPVPVVAAFPDPELVAYLKLRRAGRVRSSGLVSQLYSFATVWTNTHRPDWNYQDRLDHIASAVPDAMRLDNLDEAMAIYVGANQRKVEVDVVNDLVQGKIESGQASTTGICAAVLGYTTALNFVIRPMTESHLTLVKPDSPLAHWLVVKSPRLVDFARQHELFSVVERWTTWNKLVVGLSLVAGTCGLGWAAYTKLFQRKKTQVLPTEL